MASGPSETGRAIRLSTELFQRIELVVYVALGVLLSVTALLTLGSAALLLLEGMRDWSGTHAIFLIVDRLMFVLMLIEILHTVRGSVRSGALTPEPFLIIGLIASIRNVLVITLKSSGVTAESLASVDGEMLFRSSIVELGVLGALILIFVVSIYLLRRGRALTTANAPEADQERLRGSGEMSLLADGRPDNATPAPVECRGSAAVPKAGTGMRPHANRE
jgi:Phosphate-starvation-inducible E family